MTRSIDTAPIGVRGTGSYLPPRIRGNDEVAAASGVSAQWILERTGVRRRHAADPRTAASDLAAEAVLRALADAGIGPADLDLLILATSTPDELGPSSACRVQAAIGAHRAVAFDVAAACSGWLFGARVARDYLSSDTGARYAAVVGCEVYSPFVDETDRATAVLFADGAAAAVLGPVPAGQGFSPIVLGSDGRHAGDVLIPAGGSRRPASAATLAEGGHRIHMDGKAVRDFILEIFPKTAHEALDREGLDVRDIDVVIAHQPNPHLLRRACAEAGLPVERLVVIGDETGNIGAGSLPYALAEANATGLLHPGSRALLVAFGAGLTWGSTVLTWSADARGPR